MERQESKGRGKFEGLHGADQAERVVNWVVVSYLPIRMKQAAQLQDVIVGQKIHSCAEVEVKVPGRLNSA